MRRNIVLLNFALLALAGTFVWTLRAHWLEAKKRERAVLEQRIAPKGVIEPQPPPPVPAVAPANYLIVAQQMLFSKDRNPTVVVEPPPAKPEPPMPPLPHYHGQMAIGEPIALLSTDKDPQKGYHAGEAIGGFKLVQFDREKIAFEWMGKTVERKLGELTPKEAPATSAATPNAQAARPAPAASTPAAPAVTALGGSDAGTANSAAAKNPAGMGDEFVPGSRNCVASDKSPNGTIRDGYRKNVIESPFGQVCKWEAVK